MQGSSAGGFSSPYIQDSSITSNNRRAQNAKDVHGPRESSSSRATLRTSSRSPQPYYTTGHSIARPAQHSPNSATYEARYDVFAVTDSDAAASSPPPEDANASFQPEGMSTAAAYNSPLLFSTKATQKRFKAGTLYGEPDHSSYENDAERTPTIGRKSYLQPYRSSGLSRVRTTPRENGYPYAPAVATTSHHQEGYNGPSRRYDLRILQLLPVRIQRLFRKRRKKSLSPELQVTPSGPVLAGFSDSRLVLAALLTLVVLVYLYLPGKRASSTLSSMDQEGSLSIIQEPVKPVLPTRKWWHLPAQTPLVKAGKGKLFNATSKQGYKGTNATFTVRKKATSYAKPYHTLDELLALPSRNTLPSGPGQVSSREVPSVTVIIDCIQSRNPLSDNHKDSLNKLLMSLSEGRISPTSIRIIISPNDYPRPNPGLFGYSHGTTSIFTISSGNDRFLLTPAFNDIPSDYVLLLRCPVHDMTADASGSRADFLSTLLQIAGTEDYSSKALSTSGIARRPPGSEVHGLISYGIQAKPREEGHEEHDYRQLLESRAVDIPFGDLLIQTAWLDGLKIDDDLSSAKGYTSRQLDLVASIGQILQNHLRIQTWAIPLDPASVYTSESLRLDLITFSKRLSAEGLLEDQNNIDRVNDGTLGSPAKVAVLLSRTDREYVEAWETIICGFADESVYGHAVRVFLPSDLTDSHAFVVSCPEVEMPPLGIDAVQAWSPDICLKATGTGVDVSVSTFPCFHIEVPGPELSFLDWIVALPLESLLNWNVPRFDLAVVTNNRATSLHRLLSSLRPAHYLGDNVNLFVNMEQTTDDETRTILEGSTWPFGNIFMRHRVVLGGLMTSIVESWYPADNDTYGVLLEDDVEVSPLFYSWLKYTILHYRYGTEAMRRKSERLYGISLYQPKNIELRPQGRRKFDAHKLLEEVGIPSTLPYLSQIPCSWGAAYFPEHWKEFHQFLTIRLSEAALDLSDPIVPNIRSNRWPNSWKRYLIELVYLRGYSMLYPNYADFRSLSTNHLEQGTHVKDESQAQKRRDLFEVPLLSDQDNLMDQLPDGRLPSWNGLPIIDFWGSMVNEKEIVERGQITFGELDLCPHKDQEQVDATELDSRRLDSLNLRVNTPTYLNHDASRLLCAGTMDEQDWRDWRMRVQNGANEIDESMLLEREARLDEREKRLEELERQLSLVDLS